MLAALLLQTSVPAACAPVPLPVAVAAWRAPARIAKGDLSLGRAYRVALAPAAQVRFAVPPEKRPPEGSRAAAIGFTVTEAGRHRVLLDAGLWIDLVRDGAPVGSVAHGHGAPCSGIRKQVDFDLTPGRYVLQLSGLPVGAARVLVVRTGGAATKPRAAG